MTERSEFIQLLADHMRDNVEYSTRGDNILGTVDEVCNWDQLAAEVLDKTLDKIDAIAEQLYGESDDDDEAFDMDRIEREAKGRVWKLLARAQRNK
jgi:hypothetical protein